MAEKQNPGTGGSGARENVQAGRLNNAGFSLNHDAAQEAAFLAGAVRALLKRASVQRQAAEAATSTFDHHGKQIEVRSPEAAHALRVAADWDAIAAETAKDGGP